MNRAMGHSHPAALHYCALLGDSTNLRPPLSHTELPPFSSRICEPFACLCMLTNICKRSICVCPVATLSCYPRGEGLSTVSLWERLSEGFKDSEKWEIVIKSFWSQIGSSIYSGFQEGLQGECPGPLPDV